MKTIYIILACIFIFLLFFNGCIINIVGAPTAAAAAGTDAINRVCTDAPSVLKLTALALLAVYEVVVRIVPSVGDYSLVSWFIGILKKISDTLNITKGG
jgi:hypothetical protein